MKAKIFTEGGKTIGLGHITRCISLYQAFEQKGFDISFVVKGDETAKKLLSSFKYVIENWIDEDIRVDKSTISIIDSYIAGIESYEQISKKSSLCMYIDDNMRLNYPKGIIINGSIGAEKFNYQRNPWNEYLLGSKYTPLRKEFWDVEEKEIKDTVGSVIITFGGNDHLGLTKKILEILINHYPDITKRVILGLGFDRKSIEDIEKSDLSNIEIYSSIAAHEMKNLMLKSDIAVSAGGQTTYELANAGVPSILTEVAGNQRNNVKGSVSAGFAREIKVENKSISEDEFIKVFEEIKNKETRFKMSNIGRTAIDGKGAERIAKRALEK